MSVANAFLDCVKFRAVSTGTVDFVVSAAIAGYQTPAQAGATNGALYSYRAESDDLSQWEYGVCTYTTGSVTAARTQVLGNSSNTTSKINFTLAPQVAIVELTQDLAPANSISAGGPTGDATHVPQITYDKYGRLTAVSSIAITIPKAADQQVFTGSGTWTKPSGFSAKAYALIQAWGGGGGGARSATAANAGGGGGGAYAERFILLSSLGSTETVTIGAAGTGGPTAPSAGTAGGNTTFGSWMTVYGGGGGDKVNTGSISSGGDLFSAGSSGGSYGYLDASSGVKTTIRHPWQGGLGINSATAAGAQNAILGGGGGGSALTNTAGGTSQGGGAGGTGGGTGTVGTQPGGGGGGSSAAAGANGAAGQVTITVFDGV